MKANGFEPLPASHFVKLFRDSGCFVICVTLLERLVFPHGPAISRRLGRAPPV